MSPWVRVMSTESAMVWTFLHGHRLGTQGMEGLGFRRGVKSMKGSTLRSAKEA